MSMRSVVLVVGFLSSSLSWSAEPWSSDPSKLALACAPAPEISSEVLRLSFASDPHLHENVSAVVGVTSLGRLVVALDTNRDQYVDQYIQLTEDNRLQGPWSRRVERATVLLTKGTVRFEAPDQSIGIAAGVEGAELPRLSKAPAEFSTYIHMPAAFELLRLKAQKNVLLADVDVANFGTLPERLQLDSEVFTPQTGPSPTPCNCDENACSSGGCGAVQCSTGGGACDVTCAQPPNEPRSFACCNIGPPATCQCRRYHRSCLPG
jgi:hypothetical protein